MLVTNPYRKTTKKGALLLFAAAMLLWMVLGAEEAHVATTTDTTDTLENAAVDTKRYPLPHELLDSSGVVYLTDETFEHTTQASTGQTTGSWLLWFYNDTAKEEMFFTDAFPALDVWQDIHVVVAAVNVRKAPQTHQRFLSVKHDPLPALLYLHHGKLYRYPYASSSSSSLTYSWSALLHFCQNPTAVTVGQDIPPPPDWLHWTIAKLAASPALLSGVMVAIMVLGALLGALLEYVVPPKKATTTAIATAVGTKKKDE